MAFRTQNTRRPRLNANAFKSAVERIQVHKRVSPADSRPRSDADGPTSQIRCCNNNVKSRRRLAPQPVPRVSRSITEGKGPEPMRSAFSEPGKVVVPVVVIVCRPASNKASRPPREVLPGKMSWEIVLTKCGVEQTSQCGSAIESCESDIEFHEQST